MFSFQVYLGNVLNIYYWCVIDVDYVVVWCGWYVVEGFDLQIIYDFVKQDWEIIVEEDIYFVEFVYCGLKFCGYVLGFLVVDLICGVNFEYFIMYFQCWMCEVVDGLI